MFWYNGLRNNRSAAAASGANLRTKSSQPAFASSMVAHSPPPTSTTSFPDSAKPRDCASRFAGSIVSTTTRPRDTASALPIAAETLVLPTPPGPHTITHRPCRLFSWSSALTVLHPVAPPRPRRHRASSRRLPNHQSPASRCIRACRQLLAAHRQRHVEARAP